jgi:rhodanese-related sulfurtransferase
MLLGFSMPVNAFISPSTLTLVAASVGSLFWGFLVLIGVNIFLFFKKIRKRIRIIVLVLTCILLMAILLQINNKFLILKTINEYGIDSAINSDREWERFLKQFGGESGESLRGLAELNIGKSFQFAGASVSPIKLEDAVRNSSYRIFSVYDADKLSPDVNYKKTRLCDLVLFPEKAFYFNQMIEKYSISKTDKIVIFCDHGQTALSVALIFAFRGYNVSYATLTSIGDLRFVNQNEGVDIFIDVLNEEAADTYTYFVFGAEDSLNEFAGNTMFIDAGNPAEVNKTSIRNSKVICEDKMHCFLTIRYLDYLNITDIKKVYRINK